MLQHATGVIFLHQMRNYFQNVCVLGFHSICPLSSKSSFWQIQRAITRPGLCQVVSHVSPIVSGTKITPQIHFCFSNPSVTAENGGMTKKKEKKEGEAIHGISLKFSAENVAQQRWVFGRSVQQGTLGHLI